MAHTKKKTKADKIKEELNGIMKRKHVYISRRKVIIAFIITFFIVFCMIAFSYYVYSLRVQQATEILNIQTSISENIYYNSKKIPYKTCLLYVKTAMQMDHPLIILALASRSNYIQSWESSTAVGLCSIPSGYVENLKSRDIIVHRRDLFDAKINIKAADVVWSIIMTETKGDINKTLERYFQGDSMETVKKIMTQYWFFVYLCRRPEQSEEV